MIQWAEASQCAPATRRLRSHLCRPFPTATPTHAAMNGVSKRDIMRQTGHKSAEMLVCYIRIGEIFTRNAAAWLGI